MFTISIKMFTDYFSLKYQNPVIIQDIKHDILKEPNGKGFYYDNLTLLNYHGEVMSDDYIITETTVFNLIIKPISCHENHPNKLNK